MVTQHWPQPLSEHGARLRWLRAARPKGGADVAMSFDDDVRIAISSIWPAIDPLPVLSGVSGLQHNLIQEPGRAAGRGGAVGASACNE